MAIKNYAPIIIPTLNRYDHLKQLVVSLLKNDEACYTELVIGLDYPPSEKYEDGYQKVKSYLPTIVGFKKVTILTTDENLGVIKNIKRLERYVWEQGYDSYIFTEDDNVFAPSFLSYMSWGLNTFKNDSSVLAICSYREKDDPIPNYSNNFYKAAGVRPYGYGIWKDRYDRLEKRIEYDFMKGLVDKMPLSIIFDRRKLRIACLYLYFYDKKLYYGDFCIGQMCKDENMYCITPVKSKTKNIGFDGSGVHTLNLDRQDRELNRLLDDASTFVPIWTQENLHTQAVIDEERQISIEQSQSNFKEYGRYAFRIVKYLVYKFTGSILSYKRN